MLERQVASRLLRLLIQIVCVLLTPHAFAENTESRFPTLIEQLAIGELGMEYAKQANHNELTKFLESPTVKRSLNFLGETDHTFDKLYKSQETLNEFLQFLCLDRVVIDDVRNCISLYDRFFPYPSEKRQIQSIQTVRYLRFIDYTQEKKGYETQYGFSKILFLELIEKLEHDGIVEQHIETIIYDYLISLRYFFGSLEDILLSNRRGLLLRNYVQRSWQRTTDQKEEILFVRDLSRIVAQTKKEKISLIGLDQIFRELTNRWVTGAEDDQLALLAQIEYEAVPDWPFVNFSYPEFRRNLTKLASSCSVQACRDSLPIFLMSRISSANDIGDHDEMRTLVKTAARMLSADKSPLKQMMAEALPTLAEIGIARARGEIVRLYSLISLLRSQFSERSKSLDNALKLALIEYELIFLKIEESLGEVQNVTKYASSAMFRAESLHLTREADIQRRTLVIHSLNNFIERAQKAVQTEERPSSDNRETRIKEMFLGPSNTIDSLTNIWNSLSYQDYDAARDWLKLSRSKYEFGVRARTVTPNTILERLFQEFDYVISESEKVNAAAYWEVNPTRWRTIMVLYFALSETSALAGAELRLKEFRDFTELDYLPNRLWLLYSKQYLNQLQNIKAQLLRSGYEKQSLTYLKLDRKLVHKIAGRYIDLGLSRSSLNALEILKEQEHSEFLTGDRESSVFNTQISFDSAERQYQNIVRPIFSQLGSLTREYIGAVTGKEVKRLENALRESQERILQAIERLVSDSTIVPESRTVDRPTLGQQRDVWGRYRPTTTTVVFSVKESGVDLFVLRNSQIEIRQINIKLIELRQICYELYRSIQANTPKMSQHLEMFQRLIEGPLVEALTAAGGLNDQSLHFISDDALTLLPPQLYSKKFSTTDISISYAIVTEKLDRSKLHKRQTDFDFFGVSKGYGVYPPLPAVRDEEKFLRGKFLEKRSTARRFFIDEAVTQDQLLNSLLLESAVVHVSSHFDLRSNRDDKTGILLGNGKLLTISNIRSRAGTLQGVRLLTLAACETAVGTGTDFSGSKAFNGLATEFIKGGVDYVIATLWKISDTSSAYFSKLFYFFLLQEKYPPAAALSKTQLVFRLGVENLDERVRRNAIDFFGVVFFRDIRSYQHPFFWAGYVGITAIRPGMS